MDNNPQGYFTDMEYLRGVFKEYAAAPTLSKRLIVIHGVGKKDDKKGVKVKTACKVWIPAVSNNEKYGI